MKVKKLAQVICSLFLSFLILNAICFFYYNVPVHSESESGSTDYVWEKSKFYSKGTEGFAWGKTDANGFNNLTVENSISPEILIMGSSHTEAFNVAQNENYAYLLNELMSKSGMGWSSYNIGVSGHTITTCLSNFKNAVEEFKPGKYVVMEVSSIELTAEEINSLSDGTVNEIHSSANPIVIFLQKIPFVRCAYYQLDKMGIGAKNTNNNVPKPQAAKADVSVQQSTSDLLEEYKSALNSVLKETGSVAQKNGIKLIFLYNPDLKINKNGEVIPQTQSEKSEIFMSACRDNGIEFLNMYDAYAENYSKTCRLPHGFSNTAVGKGHLNKFGHVLIANELYEFILKLEQQNVIEA